MRDPRIKLVSFNPDSSEEVAHLRYQRIVSFKNSLLLEHFVRVSTDTVFLLY